MIVIGDIHGCLKTFKALLKKLPKDDIVLVGDLIDRGPDSYKLVQYIIKNNIPCVKGNHEDIFIHLYDNNCLDDSAWIPNGGGETMKSYKNKDIASHIKWMKNLPIYLEFPFPGRNLVVSHSLILDHWDYTPNLTDKMKDDILWDRKLKQKEQKDIFNIIGHNPQVVPLITDNFAVIDTGCVFKKAEYGKLTALQYPEMLIFQQENIED